MEEECSICLDDLDESAVTPCSETRHRFHEKCLKGLTVGKCPMCRLPLELTSELSDIISDNKDQADAERSRDLLFDLSEEAPNAKDLDFEVQKEMATQYLKKLRLKKGKEPHLLNINITEEDSDLFSKIIFGVLDARREGLQKDKNLIVSAEISFPRSRS